MNLFKTELTQDELMEQIRYTDLENGHVIIKIADRVIVGYMTNVDFKDDGNNDIIFQISGLVK